MEFQIETHQGKPCLVTAALDIARTFCFLATNNGQAHHWRRRQHVILGEGLYWLPFQYKDIGALCQSRFSSQIVGKAAICTQLELIQFSIQLSTVRSYNNHRYDIRVKPALCAQNEWVYYDSPIILKLWTRDEINSRSLVADEDGDVFGLNSPERRGGRVYPGVRCSVGGPRPPSVPPPGWPGETPVISCCRTRWTGSRGRGSVTGPGPA